MICFTIIMHYSFTLKTTLPAHAIELIQFFVFCIVFVFLTLPELKCKLQYLPRYFNSF